MIAAAKETSRRGRRASAAPAEPSRRPAPPAVPLHTLDGAGDEQAERRRVVTKLAAYRTWQVSLMRAIARSHFCLSWVEETKQHLRRGGPAYARSVHALFGRVPNVEAAVAEYTRLAEEARRRLPPEYGEPTGEENRSWFAGFSGRLVERLVARRIHREAAADLRAASEQLRHHGQLLATVTEAYGAEALRNLEALRELQPSAAELALIDARGADGAPEPPTGRAAREAWKAGRAAADQVAL